MNGETANDTTATTVMGATRAKGMTPTYYAMDFTFFSSTGTYGFADRCQITRAAGVPLHY